MSRFRIELLPSNGTELIKYEGKLLKELIYKTVKAIWTKLPQE